MVYRLCIRLFSKGKMIRRKISLCRQVIGTETMI